MSDTLRIKPQYSPHGKLEAYKVEKYAPLASDWLGQPQPDRWISVRTCLTREKAEEIVRTTERVR